MRFSKYSVLVFLMTAAVAAAADPIPGSSAEIDQILDKALKNYSMVKSYQDKLLTEAILDAEGTQVPKTPPKQEISLTYVRPNKLAFLSSDFTVVSDGKQLWQAFKPIDQFLVSEAPAELVWSELKLAQLQMFAQLRHPAILALTGATKQGQELIGDVAEYSGVTAEAHNGEPSKLIKGAVKQNGASDDAPKILFSAWFSDKTGLLQEVIYDHTARAQKQMAQSGVDEKMLKLKKYTQRLLFEKVSIDQIIPDKQFVFTPSPYDKKVAELDLPTQEEWQQKLVGRPAPDFTTEDLQGKKASLADFKGRVVLLDFWATWCGPCRMAMPFIQKMAEKYAKAPVTILGMNGDRPGTEEAVIKFLQEQKFTYRQLKEGDIGEKYRVISIPYLVLIDQKGIVQALHPGFSEESMEMLSKQIDIVLKGGILPVANAPATSTAPAVETN